MTDLTQLSLSEARKALDNKDFSSRELVEAHIKQMEKTRDLNAYITETPELALSAAKTADSHIAEGKAGILEGIPIAIKDLFCTQGVKTTAGSKILGEFTPPYESTVTSNLWKAGAVMLGKTNLDEFAMGSANLTSAYGPVNNPWKKKGCDDALVPGGSSGGSAAAVTAFAAMGATGTDTGGSIRQPAAFCGIVGLKPTYGRCSRFGTVAFASSLDQAGPMTRTVTDAALMLEAMAGHDPLDATSVNKPVPQYDKLLTGDIKGLKVGFPKEYAVEGLDPEIKALWDKGITWLKEQGAEIIDISLPHTKYALPAYYIIAPAEASSNLARYDGLRYGARIEGESLDDMYINTRNEGFGDEVKRRIMIGTYVLSAGFYDAYYMKALKIRRLIREDFDKAFEKVDVILTPSTPTAAFPVNDPPKDLVSMYMNDVLTVPANLAGLPGISLPAGINKDGLPLGLQVLGPTFSEELILKVAHKIEMAAAFNTQAKELRNAS